MTNRKASTVCTRWNCVGCACAFATICKRLEPTTGCTSRDGKQKKTKEKRNSCKASLQVLSPHQEKTRTLMLGSVRNNSQTSSTRWRNRLRNVWNVPAMHEPPFDSHAFWKKKQFFYPRKRLVLQKQTKKRGILIFNLRSRNNVSSKSLGISKQKNFEWRALSK